MITPAEAQQVAAGWARRQSLQRGYECRPEVDELTSGFAVTMLLPPGTGGEAGADVTTVIDRETGRLSHWPPVDPQQLDEIYTSRRDTVVSPHRTSDAEAELRRAAHRPVTPTVVAHLTLGGRTFRAQGAKGDQELRHHRMVGATLFVLDHHNLVRGAERHAELLVLSDALTETDKIRAAAGQAPMTMDEAKALLHQTRFETFHVREAGDPLGGRRAESCATCYDALTQLDVVPVSRRIFLTAREPADRSGLQPGRFPVHVAAELIDGGWDPRWTAPRSGEPARTMAELERRPGLEHRLERFPAATAAYAEFLHVAPRRRGPRPAGGRSQHIRPFRIGTGAGLGHLADSFHDLGTVVGARMYPLGVEGFDEAVLAIDDRGRVFALDQGGEWFIGETLDDALTALLTGRPAARIRDDGTWA